MKININSESDSPIYRQIVDFIEKEVETGNLAANTKLPAFRDLSENLGVSLGTVKRAYDELSRNGTITMTQGRGSFIAANPALQPSSKKELATELIDEMLEKLKQLSFSNQEIRIFVDLKLRELEEGEKYIKIAIIDCNIEALLMIESKLAAISKVDIDLFLLDDFLKNTKSVTRNVDLYITTFTHFSEVSDKVEDSEKLMGIVMSTSFDTVVQISKIKAKDKVATITASKKFASIISKSCNQFSEYKGVLPAFHFRIDSDLEGFMKKYDKFILPNSYHRLATKEELDIIGEAKQAGKEIIYYDYETDKGSFVYLNEKIDSMQQKQLR